MSFLPDVRMPCEIRGGTRFDRETRAVRYLGLDIGKVLALPVDEAVERFVAHPDIHHRLTLLQDLSLGYLPSGQSSPTLSIGRPRGSSW